MRGAIWEVKIPHDKDHLGYLTIAWLREQGKRSDVHYEVDMHGGRLTYTSFWFKDSKLAILTKLSCG